MINPTIETAIWLALKGRVETLALSPALPIAWPDESFSAPTAGGYLQVAHLPNQNERPWIGHDEPAMRRGILQVTLRYPTTSKHTTADWIEIAGRIAAHFPTGLRMVSNGIAVHVERAPDIARPFQADGDPYRQIPVSIRYWCEA